MLSLCTLIGWITLNKFKYLGLCDWMDKVYNWTISENAPDGYTAIVLGLGPTHDQKID